ncbi:MAG TPA: rhodanese-like domain-containing protein [Lachnospiraceae bacterium]|nr:rhodanese-like domain-containing protein [Lachnospiraceae bacterium]
MKRKSVIALGLAAVLGCSLLGGCGKKTVEPVERQRVETDEDKEEKQETENTQEPESEKQEPEVPDDGRFHGKWIVDAEYAKGRVGAEDTLFVDSRGEKQAILGTIDGAIATVWQDWCITEGKSGDEKWGCIPEPEVLSGILGNLGITKDKEIILLGETKDGWGDDSRLLWELLAAGYTDVKMVDGGLSALKEAGAPTQFLASRPEAGEVSIDKIDYSHVMTTEELQKNYDQYKIVDVRTDEEYNGAILYDEAQGGHLPGAIHIRYTDLFQEDGTLKPNKELVQMFEDAGLSKDDSIVTYCTGGIRSSYMQLVLEMCGFEDSYNYDQSFWRWAVVGEVE